MRIETKLWLAVAVLMVSLTAIGTWVGLGFLQEREEAASARQGEKAAQDAGEVVATEGDDLAARVLAACREGGEAAKALTELDACAQANRTRETIEDAPVEPDQPQASPAPRQTRYVPVPGRRGPGPTLAQIGRSVAGAIDDVVADQIDAAVADQLEAALRRVCGGSCNGKDAVAPPAPADGKDGRDAPRITSIACDGTTGVFRFSDDSTIRVDDMCHEPGLLEPPPDPAE